MEKTNRTDPFVTAVGAQRGSGSERTKPAGPLSFAWRTTAGLLPVLR